MLFVHATGLSGRLDRTLYWLSHHVEQTHNELYPSNKKKTLNITFTFERLWHAFFGRGDNFPLHCDDCTFVSTSWTYTQVSSPVMPFFRMFSSTFERSNSSWLTETRFSFCASVSRRGIKFAATRRIYSVSVKIRCTNFYRFLLLRQLRGQLGDDFGESQQALLQHIKSLRESFCQFETEFDTNGLLLSILHLSTCKKSPRVLNTHSFKRV